MVPFVKLLKEGGASDEKPELGVDERDEETPVSEGRTRGRKSNYMSDGIKSNFGVKGTEERGKEESKYTRTS